jgi:transposase
MHTEFVTGVAVGAKLAGLNDSEVARICKENEHLPIVDRRTVKTWFDLFKEHGFVLRQEKSGRPKKLSIADERHLVVTAKRHKFDSVAELIIESGLNICHQTCMKYLNDNDLYSCRIKFKQYLSPLNLKQRK